MYNAEILQIPQYRSESSQDMLEILAQNNVLLFFHDYSPLNEYGTRSRRANGNAQNGLFILF